MLADKTGSKAGSWATLDFLTSRMSKRNPLQLSVRDGQMRCRRRQERMSLKLAEKIVRRRQQDDSCPECVEDVQSHVQALKDVRDTLSKQREAMALFRTPVRNHGVRTMGDLEHVLCIDDVDYRCRRVGNMLMRTASAPIDRRITEADLQTCELMQSVSAGHAYVSPYDHSTTEYLKHTKRGYERIQYWESLARSGGWSLSTLREQS